jgi:hypothetical protein
MAQTQEAQSFQGRYSLAFRCVELGAFAVFFTEMVWLGVRLSHKAQTHATTMLAALFLGFLTMDFLSGMFHWAGDTWGSVHWPVIGSTVIRTFREFSPDFGDFARHSLANRWIEAENRSGKRQGAFCTGFPTHKESRVFMTLTNTHDNVSTLAHELGHAYHSWVLREQPLVCFSS